MGAFPCVGCHLVGEKGRYVSSLEDYIGRLNVCAQPCQFGASETEAVDSTHLCVRHHSDEGTPERGGVVWRFAAALPVQFSASTDQHDIGRDSTPRLRRLGQSGHRSVPDARICPGTPRCSENRSGRPGACARPSLRRGLRRTSRRRSSGRPVCRL